MSFIRKLSITACLTASILFQATCFGASARQDALDVHETAGLSDPVARPSDAADTEVPNIASAVPASSSALEQLSNTLQSQSGSQGASSNLLKPVLYAASHIHIDQSALNSQSPRLLPQISANIVSLDTTSTLATHPASETASRASINHALSLEVPQGYVALSPGVYVPKQYVQLPMIAFASSGIDSSSSLFLPQPSNLPNGYASSPAPTVQLDSTPSEFPRYPLLALVPTTSPYGMRWGRLHAGVDFGTQIGTPIVASLSGEVIFQGWYSGYGKAIILRHTNGTIQTLYGHLSEILVRNGQSVRQGEIIGQSGNTGNSTGPHLHFEMRHFANNAWSSIDINHMVVRAAQNLQSGQVASTLPSTQPQPQTRLTSTPVEMRVALAMNEAALTVASSTPALVTSMDGRTLSNLPALQGWTVQSAGSDLLLNQQRMPSAVFIQPQKDGLVLVNNRWYRGRVLLANRPSGLLAVNWVKLEHYIASVVGSEAYPSWNPNALKAQAIAARSYALAFRYRPSNSWYDLQAGPQNQAYNGVSGEFNTTYRAAIETQGQVLVVNGGVVEAQYAATQSLTDSAHHGFGMSQWGAADLADQGNDYQAILQRYYPGALISWIKGNR